VLKTIREAYVCSSRHATLDAIIYSKVRTAFATRTLIRLSSDSASKTAPVLETECMHTVKLYAHRAVSLHRSLYVAILYRSLPLALPVIGPRRDKAGCFTARQYSQYINIDILCGVLSHENKRSSCCEIYHTVQRSRSCHVIRDVMIATGPTIAAACLAN